MAYDSLYLTQAENDIKRYVWKRLPDAHIFFLLHGQNSRMDEAIKSFSKFNHPATRTALHLVKKTPDQNASAFLGVAVGTGTGLWGLGKKSKYMGICAINLDSHESESAQLLAMTYNAYHTLDILEFVTRPENVGRFKNGVLAPNRKPEILRRLNLKADIFSCLYASKFIGPQALKMAGRLRALIPLSPAPKNAAHTMPLPIAIPILESAYDDFLKVISKLTGEALVKACMDITNDVSEMITDGNLQEWMDFCTPAQDMAWQGFSAQEIISAALGNGSNPFLKSTGFLVSDMATIKPDNGLNWIGVYNAFLDKVEIGNAHSHVVDEALEKLLQEGMSQESSQPLRNAANHQNEELLQGHSFGWCAAALQASARAFDKALTHGLVPVQAARLEFEGTYSQYDWQTIKDLGDIAIMRRQEGHMLSLDELMQITREDDRFRHFERSFKETAEDPNYQEKLLLGNELNKPVPQFAVYTPAPATPTAAPAGPVLAATPKAPGFGPGGSSSLPPIVRTQQQEEQK